MPTVKLIAQRGAKRGTEVIIQREQTLIGRSRSCQVCIPAPQVSRQHCAILIENGQVIVRDLGSTNGTFVNGVQVSEQQLTTGDTLTIGNVVFLVKVEEAEALAGSDTARPGQLAAVDEAAAAEAVDSDLVFADEAETQQAVGAVAEEVLDAEVVEEEGVVTAEPVEEAVLDAEPIDEDRITDFLTDLQQQQDNQQG